MRNFNKNSSLYIRLEWAKRTQNIFIIKGVS
jgi:hypothetical protein